MKHAALLIVCLAIAPFANAQPLSGGYVGFGVGSYDYRETDAGLVIVDDSASAWRAVGGYEVKKHLAVEGSWGRTKGLRGSFTPPAPPGVTSTTFDIEEKYETYTIRAVGILPLKRLELLAGAGYYNSRLDLNVRAQGLTGEINDDTLHEDGAMLLGAVQFNLYATSIRAEYEKFDASSGIKASQVTLNVVIKF